MQCVRVTKQMKDSETFMWCDSLLSYHIRLKFLEVIPVILSSS